MLFNHLGGDLIHTELHHLKSMYLMNSLSSIIEWQKMPQEHRVCLQVFNTVITYFSGSVWRTGRRKRKDDHFCYVIHFCCTTNQFSRYDNVMCLSWGISIYKPLPLYSPHPQKSLNRICYVTQRLFCQDIIHMDICNIYICGLVSFAFSHTRV